jgi:ribosomal protein L16 Arg81 hydroxylase
VTASTAIPANWIEWIEENLALGVEEQKIVQVLVDNSFNQRSATDEVRRRRVVSPASEPVPTNLPKLEAMMAIYSNLWSQGGGMRGAEVDRRKHINPEEFFYLYYSANRPVVLLDQFRESPALTKWDPEYLRSRCGAEMVEVMTGRASDRNYEINSNNHKSNMKLSAFIDKVKAAGDTNDFYMVANNRALESRSLQTLIGEIQLLQGLLDPSIAAGRVFLWLGPKGTVTPLHHDTSNILLAQVYGRKMVTIIPSFQTPLVYNHVGVYSKVDCERPDYRRFPLFRKATPIKILLEPGQALFLPVGWWHHVRSLDVSISLSFTNFRAPNSYAWE